jgi:hypothetical protein
MAAPPLTAEAMIDVGSEGLVAIVGQVTGPVHLILYVRDQAAATAFWRAALDRPPNLDVPGMTEFPLGTQVVLGLVPRGWHQVPARAVPAGPGRRPWYPAGRGLPGGGRRGLQP